jgi:DNA-binding MarR family transcriptional regulator
MTAQKLIGRQRSDADRRLVRTTITKRGLDLLGRLDAPVREFHRARLAGLPERDLRQLVDTLAEMRNAG